VGGAVWRQRKMAASAALFSSLRSRLRVGARALCARLAPPPPRASEQVSQTVGALRVRGPSLNVGLIAAARRFCDAAHQGAG
jgi:import inner membrane translocase subunit TIM50